ASCSGLCAKHFDAKGVAVGDLIQINTVPAMSRDDVYSPPTKSMAMSAAGDFAVVWEYAPLYGHGPAYGRHFQADGTPTGSADYALTSATAYSPMVAINGSG